MAAMDITERLVPNLKSVSQKTSQFTDTAYPKITGIRKQWLKELGKMRETSLLPSMIIMEGTVKLHGMHADIVFDLSGVRYERIGSSSSVTAFDDRSIQIHDCREILSTVTFQSRNRVCALTESAQGWPCNLANQPGALTYIRQRILRQFYEMYGSLPKTTYPLIVAGEWIGNKIQKDVGINQLSPRFVIIGIQVEGRWQDTYDYANVEATKADIYNIHRVPMFRIKYDTTIANGDNEAFVEMQRLADEVEARCPFAAQLGVTSLHDSTNSQADNSSKPIGGEGIVWIPDIARNSPDLWFKTKGPKFSGMQHLSLDQIIRETKQSNDLNELCVVWVSDRRVAQGFEYLTDMEVRPQDALKAFQGWIVNDVIVEEALSIESYQDENGVIDESSTVRKVKRKIAWLAREKYLDLKTKFD